MHVADNTVVQFNYTLKNEEGDTLDTNVDNAPLAYLHGHNGMLEGIEKAMTGKEAGETFSITLTPEEGYGERKEDMIQRVPVKHLHGAKKWKAGMMATVHTEQGERQVVLAKVGKFMADVDMNHPLAGLTLNFDLEVVSVREATEEELSHGHAHGEGGHQH
ncbi:FKBP-type peptidyl-prolyl cis-trans isomerase [Oceanisphaera pacifica]|uniref:Peptidyl-prolyl cis-trans isomerase n=1 Tax=Oceanisphaera pacifica TaxID=2818389 RepID=A0ABS3NHC0_9GAMM|nr:peptidylprolyl isomerase [Oceanisphaera pacifica]MBO1519935.1 peptidylprolyl isomerase [Oceanisphaera pacifica]